MCYDISFTVKLKDLTTYFPDLVESPQLELDFESDHIIAHRYPEYPIVRRNHEGAIVMEHFEWGVIPFYVKDENKFIRHLVACISHCMNRNSSGILLSLNSIGSNDLVQSHRRIPLRIWNGQEFGLHVIRHTLPFYRSIWFCWIVLWIKKWMCKTEDFLRTRFWIWV